MKANTSYWLWDGQKDNYDKNNYISLYDTIKISFLRNRDLTNWSINFSVKNKEQEIFKVVYYEHWAINLLEKIWQDAQTFAY